MTKRLILFGAAAICASAQSWTEFSIGAAGHGKTSFGREGLRSEGMPLIRIVSRAYGVPEFRIVAPGWTETERYAITALVASPKDFEPLMQQELAQRFDLSTHRQLRDVAVYRMRTIPNTEQKREQPCAPMGDTPPRGVSFLSERAGAANLADHLANLLNRPVIDETGIEGKFNACLQWKGTTAALLPGVVRDQLGLELVEGTAATEFLVIDHMEKLRVAR